ncbi:MAG: cation:proton antiporter [Candidatus Riflebacteria bacterium]|nr:cation:proton antiporter [Candidatus Riflebacteria bacterium]
MSFNFHALDLLVIFALSLGIVSLFVRLRLPIIVGYIVAGVVVGPHGLRVIHDQAAVQELAQIGVALLLFSVGLETPLSAVFASRRIAVATVLQVSFGIVIGTAAGALAGLSMKASLAVGFMFATTSTAVARRELEQRAEAEAPHGRIVISMLIIQDLLAVPMTVLVPLLVDDQTGAKGIVGPLLTAVLVFFGLLVGARLLMEPFFRAVIRTRSKDLFVLAVAAVVMGATWVGNKSGLSPAMGAFLAGTMLEASDYAHHTLSLILPFRDAFLPIFFVSVGMLVDPRFALGHPFLFVGGLAVIVVVKLLVTLVPLVMMRQPLRPSLMAALALAQVGEFTFVLLNLAYASGLVPTDVAQAILSLTMGSLLMAPLAIRSSSALSSWLLRRISVLSLESDLTGVPPSDLTNHVIIVGFGINGRNVARVLRAVEVPYQVIELNADTVSQYRAAGEPIHFGDATSEELLRHLAVERARKVVISITDPPSTMRMVRLIHEMAPRVSIIVRTRFLAEIERYYSLGAAVVVADEMEASLRLVRDILARFGVPAHQAIRMTDELCEHGYSPLLDDRMALSAILPFHPTRHTVPIESPCIGHSLAELDLRRKTGVTCLSIERGDSMMTNPDGNTRIQGGDCLVLLGSDLELVQARSFLDRGQCDPRTGKLHEGA